MRAFLALLIFLGELQGAQYSLCDVLSLTLLNNPDLASFNYDMRGADAKILQASFFPNPGIDVETENFGAPIFMQTTVLFNQLIELGGKRQARVNLARSERDRVSLDYEVLKRQLFVETTVLFIDVLVNQQKISFFEENLKVLQDFSSVVEKRIKAGKASMIEEANFLVMLNNALIDLRNGENELKLAKNKLAAKWADPNNDCFMVVGTIEEIPEIISLCELGGFLEEHPQVSRLNFEEDVRAAKVSVEKSKAYPDLNVRGGPRYLEEAHKWVWVVGFFMPLPLFDRNQGNIWESKENLDKIEREREALWTKLLSELNGTYFTLETAFLNLNILRDRVLPAAQKAYDYSYKGYEIARYNYLELLETERAYRTTRMRYLQSLGEYHKALAILQGLTGSKAIMCEQYDK